QNATLREQLASMSPHLLEQAVAREIPNWKEINRDPAWLQWLAGRHPYSGWTRQQLLDERTGNSHRVISLFRGYLGDAAVRQQAAVQEPYQRTAAGRTIYSRQQIVDMSKRRM